MIEEIDSPPAGESLTIDQAAAAYSKAMAPKEAPPSQSDEPEAESGDTTDDELQASDDDASEEGDGETETEGQADDGTEDDEEPDSDQGRFVASNGKVKLPDGTVSTIADLIQGNLRDRDYRQKTMEAAEVKKAAEAQSTALKASEEQLEQQREYVASLVKSILPPQPDPAKADPRSPAYDPAGYQAEEVAYRQWAQHLAYLEAEQQRTTTERQAKAAEESKGKVDKEWAAALERMPELKDQKKLESFGKDTIKFGAEYGYTSQELANIHHDHRQLLVMKDAIAWRKLQASKATAPKKVEGRPPVIKGGKRLNPSEHRSRTVNDAITTAQKTGRLEDVAAAYHASRKGT